MGFGDWFGCALGLDCGAQGGRTSKINWEGETRKIGGKPENIGVLEDKKVNQEMAVNKTWKQPKCPSTDEWIKMWCIYTQWDIAQP